MQNLTIALVQANQYWEDKRANRNNYESLLEELTTPDLILLPEMFNTGFTMNALEMSEELDNSESLDWLKALAAKRKTAFFTSMIVEDSKEYYNRGLFIHPDERVEIYDKRKCFGLAGEDRVFSAGKLPKIVEYKGWKIMLQICYDLRFPEIVRNSLDETGTSKYDMILYVANWPERRIEHWKTLLKARAIENQCYVAAVNRVGTDGSGLIYSGDSALIDPLGQIVKTETGKEIIIEAVADFSILKQVRETLPFLKDI